MRFKTLVVCLALLAVFTMAVRISADTDTWWHLAAGRWMVEHRQLLEGDPFSWTRAGQEWINPSWLAQLLLYGTHRLAGLPGLNLLTALMVTLALGSVWPIMEGPGLLRAFVLVGAASVSAVYWSARPQIVSFALAGACLLLLEKGRDDRRWWLMLPGLMALWANVHGGFAIGLLLIGVHFGGELVDAIVERLTGRAGWSTIWLQRKAVILTLLVVLAISAVSVALNPYGLRLVAYPVQTVSLGTLQAAIDEWQSPDFHQPDTLPFLAMLAVTILVIAVSPKRRTGREMLLFALLAALALVARRNLALFALCLAPTVARHTWALLEPWAARGRWANAKRLRPRAERVVNSLVLGFLLLAALAKMMEPLSPERNQQAVREQQPLDAIAFLQTAQPPGPLFHSYTWGGYLIWDVWPLYATFADGRTDLFGDQVLSDYVRIWNANAGWEDRLQSYGARLAMVERYAPVVGEMKDAGWLVLHSDSQAVILAAPAAQAGG